MPRSTSTVAPDAAGRAGGGEVTRGVLLVGQDEASPATGFKNSGAAPAYSPAQFLGCGCVRAAPLFRALWRVFSPSTYGWCFLRLHNVVPHTWVLSPAPPLSLKVK